MENTIHGGCFQLKMPTSDSLSAEKFNWPGVILLARAEKLLARANGPRLNKAQFRVGVS